jgi:tetratricopeptide (TPR) repeat protein
MLGVFVGGFDVDAVQTIMREIGEEDLAYGSATGVTHDLTALVNRSLVAPNQRDAGHARFHLLETLRAYAVEQLVAHAEQAQAEAAHARYVLQLAQRAFARYNAAAASAGLLQPWWLALEENQENVRAALQWLLAHDAVGALQLAVWLHPYWEMRGHQREGSRRLTEALDQVLAQGGVPLPLLAEGLRKAGNFAQQLCEYPQASDLLARALVAYQTVGDAQGVATTLRAQGWLAADMVDRPASVAHFQQSLALFRTLGDLAMTAKVLADLVHVLGDPVQQHAEAQAYATESLAIFRGLGDAGGIAYALQQMGQNETRVGHYAEAAAAYGEALGLLRRLQATREIGWALEQLGEAMWHQGAIDAAQTYWLEALELFRANEIDHGMMLAHHHLAQVARVQQDWAHALQRYGTALGAFWVWQNLAMTARCLAGMGSVLTAQGRAAPAAQFLAVAQRLFDEQLPFLAPADQREFAQMVEALRVAVGAGAFARVWAEGGTASVEETVTLALSHSREAAAVVPKS